MLLSGTALINCMPTVQKINVRAIRGERVAFFFFFLIQNSYSKIVRVLYIHKIIKRVCVSGESTQIILIRGKAFCKKYTLELHHHALALHLQLATSSEVVRSDGMKLSRPQRLIC